MHRMLLVGALAVSPLLVATACTEHVTIVKVTPEAGAEDDGPDIDSTDAGSVDASDGAVVSEDDGLVLDLGDVSLGEDVTFTLPQGALGFHVLVEGTGQQEVGVERITSPSGKIVHDAFMPAGGSHETSLSSFGSIAAAAVPQSDLAAAAPLETGMWTVRFNPKSGNAQGAKARARVRVQQTDDGAFHGGTLDIRVWVPQGLRISGPTASHVVDPANAAADEAITARIDRFYGALEEMYGIGRGTVRYLEAPRTLAVVDDESKLLSAFRMSEGQSDGSVLNVVLTNDILSLAWGIAPGIPGAVGRAGTAASGIVIAHLDTPVDGDALTMLHEMSHFVGLNHTSETASGGFDPLDDTPQCPGLDLNDPNTLAACGDNANLMFPVFYGTAGTSVAVSDTQRRVVRGAPIYRARKSGPTGGALAVGPSLSAAPFRLTRSGRRLSALETTLLARTWCGTSLHSSGAARSRPMATDAELRNVASDDDLPLPIRREAKRWLTAATP